MAGPTIRIPTNSPATSNGECRHLDMEVVVGEDGLQKVYLWIRKTGSSKTDLMTFDAYEWERFKKMIGVADELMKKIESGGAVFKIG